MAGSLVVWDKASELLEYVYEQLECTLTGRPCQTLIATCEPYIPCCDYLAVYVEELPGQSLVEDCTTYTDEDMVVFKVKLVRPCNTVDPCSPTLEDVNAVKAQFVDRAVIRAALKRFAEKPSDCFVQYDLLPVTSVCDEHEKCTVTLAGITLSMSLCDDGECTIPFTTSPARCDCDPVFVNPVGVNVNDTLTYE